MSDKSNNHCPRLIEVALPIREISAESVRDKSIRHGHLSTLHLWWARRPLAASRAIVFASLVLDPDDTRCPDIFRHLVLKHLKTKVPKILQYYNRNHEILSDTDPYKPYDGIPDTLRNRLLAFIAKWSPEKVEFELGKATKSPAIKDMIDDRSLIKWETSNPENLQGQEVLKIAREFINICNGGIPPIIFDPFAGGGAIPLEAGRLGCRAIGNDYNPVAYIILRSCCEYPQKYGVSGKRKVFQEEFGKHIEKEVDVPNVLIYDFEKWANWILDKTRKQIGYLYPPGKDGNTIVGYLWARTAPCSNPACRKEIPLLRNLLICNKPNKKVALRMIRKNNEITFGIVKDKGIKEITGTMIEKGRGNTRCPFCHQIVTVGDLKKAFLENKNSERMIAVITETNHGKDYRAVEESDLEAFKKAELLASKIDRPKEPMPVKYTQAFPICTWGFTTWGSLFNARQILIMQTFKEILGEALKKMKFDSNNVEYEKAIATYLGFLLSRSSQRLSNVGIWDAGFEKINHPFGRQAIPLTWDYPETNPFSDSTGGICGQIDWISRVIHHESTKLTSNGIPTKIIRSDASNLQIENNYVDAVVTDPPYFDAISYADLSDFFYVWLKRTLEGIYPEALSTPLTPKSDEVTMLKHRHSGDIEKARKHFTSKLTACFSESNRICKKNGLITVMFAHQSTEAWSALIKSLFDAGLTVTATYPIDTELISALKSWKSVLASSITVVCRQRKIGSAVALREVRKEIDKVVSTNLRRYWNYGLRGADLIVACYGPAVGVFGQYERVERADGTIVDVNELLDLARDSALKSIAGEFKGDELSRLYFIWANVYGTDEQAWDDVRLIVLIGIENESAMEVAKGHGIFVVDGSKCRLALLSDRSRRKNLGMEPNPSLIDSLHRAMLYWKSEERNELIKYLVEHDLLDHAPYWSLVQALFDVLPRETPDWKYISALLGEREVFQTEAKKKGRVREEREPELFT